MIELRHVTHRFGERTVLRELSLTLAEPRIAVIGANGSGKSTFARLLNGLVVPSEGTVRVHGLDTAREGRAVRRRVGFVFQNPDAQIVYPTVEEDIAFGLKSLGLSKAQVAERVAAALARHGLAHLRRAPAHLLSGGEKQMLAIAGVLAMAPDVLVLDEPTTLLDLRNTRRVEQTLAGLPQQVVLVTHDLALAQTFGRVLVFEGGAVVADGAPQDAIPFYRRLMQC